MNKLVQELEMKTNLIENTKGSLYYNSSLDYNLDLFCKLSRYNPTDELIRTHGKNNKQAKMLVKKLGISEKEYRNILKTLRSRINIVESNLTNKEYEKIDFEKVPTKAMLKYKDFFKNNLNERYKEYLNDVVKGDKKINTKGLYCYEIVRQILFKQESLTDEESLLFDDMWNNQRDFLNGYDKDVAIVSGFNTSILENITNIENINPIKIMICTLEKYVKLLSTNEEREVKVL